MTIKNSQREPSTASKEFMLAEYERLRELFIKNEEDGNTRINLFITLTTSLMGAFGITKQFEDKGNYGILFLPILIGLFLLGFFILRRLIRRNISGDEMKTQIDKIREYFVKHDESRDLEKFIPYPINKGKNYHNERIQSWKKWYSPGTGGYVQIIVLLNSFIFGFMMIILFSSNPIFDIFVSTNGNDTNQNNKEKNNFDLLSFIKSNPYFILVSLFIIAITIIVYVLQRYFVLNIYKIEEKDKLNKLLLNNCNSLVIIDKPKEQEISFIIFSDDPKKVINEKIILAFRIGNNYQLKGNVTYNIIDKYYDILPYELLQKSNFSLRTRKMREKEFITFKGPTKENEFGNPIRLEIEKPWSTKDFNITKENFYSIISEVGNSIPSIRTYIKKRQQQQSLEPDVDKTLENHGLTKIQERETCRQEIAVYVQDGISHTETKFAKLCIDDVKFFILNKNDSVYYYNIEVELDIDYLKFIGKDKPEDLQKYSYYLSEFKDKFLLEFYPDVREWKHSKFATGKAINELLKQNDNLKN